MAYSISLLVVMHACINACIYAFVALMRRCAAAATTLAPSYSRARPAPIFLPCNKKESCKKSVASSSQLQRAWPAKLSTSSTTGRHRPDHDGQRRRGLALRPAALVQRRLGHGRWRLRRRRGLPLRDHQAAGCRRARRSACGPSSSRAWARRWRPSRRSGRSCTRPTTTSRSTSATRSWGPVARGAVSGAACGFAVSFCAVPVDVVKINAQKMHVSAYESMRTLYKQRGLRFVAHGGVATVLHLTLSQMAFFATLRVRAGQVGAAAGPRWPWPAA